MLLASGWRRDFGGRLHDGQHLGKKNCELGEEGIAWICETFLAFKETEHSRIFDNAAFGYWKVTVEWPLRIEGIDPKPRIQKGTGNGTVTFSTESGSRFYVSHLVCCGWQQ